MAWWIWSGVVLAMIISHRENITAKIFRFIDWFSKLAGLTKILLILACVVAASILSIAACASFLPPHLVQESDAMMYHITVPRQHLLRGTFDHISWSTADLYYLPLDFALAPYWLSTSLPNKIPQIIFLFGLLMVSTQIAFRLSQSYFASTIVFLAICGTHGIGIQMGTAMLDLIGCYLFISFLDSVLRRTYWLAAVEFTLFFWSKSFIPFQVIFVFIVLGAVYLISQKLKFREYFLGFAGYSPKMEGLINGKTIRRLVLMFLLLSIFIAGPFMGKSLSISGTPVFPIKPFIFGSGVSSANPVLAESIKQKALQVNKTKTQYGSGRGIKDFINHFWIIAVPEKKMKVNNRYDYPLGLTYLLFMVPFLILTGRMCFNRKFGLLPALIVVYWISWWMLTQQSRFLFIPVVLMFIIASCHTCMQSRVLLAMLIIALLSTLRSVYGAHHQDFGKSAFEVLRPKDKELIEMTKEIKDDQVVNLDYPDVAYAGFPVVVRGSESVFVLKF